jgi:hypothetical protein
MENKHIRRYEELYLEKSRDPKEFLELPKEKVVQDEDVLRDHMTREFCRALCPNCNGCCLTR